jgi:hypothetical protein
MIKAIEKVFDNGFRLIGLVEKGSIPLTLVCFVAFFLTTLIRLVALILLGQRDLQKEGKNMEQKTSRTKWVAYSMLESIWAIGASGVAGALLA